MNYSDVFPPLNRSIPINNNINQYFVLPFGIDLNIEVSYFVCKIFIKGWHYCVWLLSSCITNFPGRTARASGPWSGCLVWENLMSDFFWEVSQLESLKFSSTLSVVVVFAFFFCWTPFHSQRLMFVMVSIVLNINDKLQWKLFSQNIFENSVLLGDPLRHMEQKFNKSPACALHNIRFLRHLNSKYKI